MQNFGARSFKSLQSLYMYASIIYLFVKYICM